MKWTRVLAATNLLLAAAVAVAQEPAKPPAAAPAQAAPQPAAQQHFESPEAAGEALVAALKARDSTALLAVLGQDAEPIIDSGDPVADRNAGEGFVEAYALAHSFAPDEEGSLVLQVGEDDWPLPIPLVQGLKGWRFDSLAGQEEILNRRIGRNELHTIQSLLAAVDAQREYYVRNPEGGNLPHFAARFASTAGKKDGLYWPVAEGEEPSPLGELFADASEEGYKLGGSTGPVPYHGYYYRILTSQGPSARGGAYDYRVRDVLFGGFAILASPAEWENSGVMTFLVNHDGVVFQKDLGPDTETLAPKITVFDPGEGWTPVAESDLVLPAS
jgi:hypothetical protein